MTSSYRVLVHCDEQQSKQCAGLVEFTLREPREIDHLGTQLFQRGWLRGYRPDGPSVTYDVCPACAPTVRARTGEPAPDATG